LADKPTLEWVKRPYTAEEVLKLRGSYKIDYTIATEMSKNSGKN
jgi:isocitrate lyase